MNDNSPDEVNEPPQTASNRTIAPLVVIATLVLIAGYGAFKWWQVERWKVSKQSAIGASALAGRLAPRSSTGLDRLEAGVVPVVVGEEHAIGAQRFLHQRGARVYEGIRGTPAREIRVDLDDLPGGVPETEAALAEPVDADAVFRHGKVFERMHCSLFL